MASANTTILDYYQESGFKMVRLSADAKKAIDGEWQKKDVELEKLKQHVERGGNVGLQMGEVSDWRGCVEVDCPEAVALAPKFLPETLTAGRNAEPRHYLYRSPGLGYKTFQVEASKELMAIKASDNGKGHYVVVAPSRHPDKGQYLWRLNGFNPAAITEVSAPELKKRAELLAVAVLIARHLPPKGRHHLSLCLAGYMLRNGESQEDVLRVLEAAWSYHNAPREAFQSLQRNVRDTVGRLERDEPATGGRQLEELFSGMPKKIAKFLGWEQVDYDGASLVLADGRRRYERSDLGNAERFIARCGDRVRWVPARKSWLVYDGKCWRLDECGEVLKLAQETARSIHKDAAAEPDQKKQAEIARFAISSQNENRINGMLSMAKPHVAVRMEELDSDRWAINCQNGTLDLGTGTLKPHDPADLITKIVPVDYEPHSSEARPRFEKFLKEVLIDDAVITFVKRFAGYTATGITRERVFAILYGFGKNGKSTLIELLQDVLGDYATNTDTETILTKRYAGVGNDVAALKGARFVSAAEVEKGRRLAESKVKQLTGSDTVTARFLFGEPFNFRPEFKLWLSTNHKPEIRGTDDAIWDRVKLIPFTQRFEGNNVDPELPEKLRKELSGVFAWIVEGCLEWQEHGLSDPEPVAAATEQYRNEMDTLAAFIEDRCVLGDELVAPAASLYQAYKDWSEKSGENVEPQKTFGMMLAERGFASDRITSGPHKGRKGWRGLGLRVDPSDSPESFEVNRANPSSSNGERSNPNNPTTNGAQGSIEEQPMHDNGSPFTGTTDFDGPPPHENAQESLLRAFLEDPPEWFIKQARYTLRDHRDLPEYVLEPLVKAVTNHLYGGPQRWREAVPAVKEWLGREDA